MGGLSFPKIEQVEACTTVVLSRYGGGMFGYLLSLAPDRDEPALAWADGQLGGPDAEVTLTGMVESPLVMRLSGEALALSRRAR